MKGKENTTGAGRPVPPAIVTPGRAEMPPVCEDVLDNGVRLYMVDIPGQEVVRVSFVFRAGTSLQEVPFSASAAVNLLSEGSRRSTAAQIAERLDFYGSYYEVSTDRDYAVVTFCSLSRFFAETMEVAEEILLAPEFPQDEVRTYCSKQKQRLAVERTKVAFQARELFSRTLFGAEHPYGVSSPAERYDTLGRDDLIRFYRRYYTGRNCFAVASGDVNPDARRRIAALAGKLPAGDAAGLSGMAEPVSLRYAFGSHPGALQSALRVGTRLFPRTHPDFIPMQVVTTVLGGYFGSRLVRNLREERGYTYGVFAGMVNLEYEGYMAIATEVAAAAAEDAVDQIFREMERLRNEAVEERELQMVKNIVAGEVMRILDGLFGIADVTIENVQNGTDNGYIGRFLERVRSTTPEEVLATARKYLVPERFTTVVVGDADPSRAGKAWGRS